MTKSAITSRIRAMAEEIEPYVIEKRRYFHAHPELSMHEVKTSDALAAALDEIGVSYVRPYETGLIVTIKGEAPNAFTMRTGNRSIALLFV